MRGFTLVELLIAIAVVGILAAVAIPSYSGYVQKGRRADGRSALMRVQLAQENWRANNTAYASALSSLNVGSASPDGYYTLSVSGASATGYTVSAAPAGAQVGDPCGTLSITLSGGTLSYNPTKAASPQCWR